MCVIAIVDTDSLAILMPKDESEESLFCSWVEKRHGVLAYSDYGRYSTEVSKNLKVLRLFGQYEQGGHLKKIPMKEILEAEKKLRKRSYRSNDRHILALALASNATILCSNDKNLRLDFKDKAILPRVSRKQRLLYPIDGNRKQRRQFLNRQRCPNVERAII